MRVTVIIIMRTVIIDMTKIVCISDTHTRHYELKIPPCDILIHAGDMTGRGSLFEFKEIGDWFKSLLAANVCQDIIFIAGNHDFGLQRNPTTMLNYSFDHSRIHYLQDSSIILKGIKFYGSPWTPEFHNWAFMKSDDDLIPIWNQIDINTNILITHGPAYEILDKNINGTNCGSRSLLSKIEDLSLTDHLKYHIFGHIHEQGGKRHKAKIISYNVSNLDERYKVIHKPMIIKYKD